MANKKEGGGHAHLVMPSLTMTATGTVEAAVSAVEASSKIPQDAKIAIKDFIRERFDELKESAPNLENFPVPPEVAEWWHIIVEILQNFF